MQADDPERLAVHRELRERVRQIPGGPAAEETDEVVRRAEEIVWLYRELRYHTVYGSDHAAALVAARLIECGEPTPEEWHVRRKER